MSNPLKPLVGIISDVQNIAPHDYHTAGDKYVRSLSRGSDVVPVIIPSVLDDQSAEQWLSRLDGLLLTGAYSMVDPSHYEEARIDKPYQYDASRDRASFDIVRKAMELDVPLLGICRGLQDINVAFGGVLHQAVQEQTGLNDHREDKELPLAEQYAPVHPVRLTPGGKLAQIFNSDTIKVNSLHSQGIKTVGSGLTVEAVAEDGLVEGISIDGMSFGIAVQWHPEWDVMNNPLQKLLFEAFGKACRARQSK